MKKQSAKAPQDPLVLETLANRAMYLGFPELAIPALEKLGPGAELELAEAYSNHGDDAKARLWTERALAENPYDWYALHSRQRLAEKIGTEEEVGVVEAQIAGLSEDPAGRVHPVELQFSPAQPKFHPETTLESDGVTVFDHSNFGVTMTNRSAAAGHDRERPARQPWHGLGKRARRRQGLLAISGGEEPVASRRIRLFRQALGIHRRHGT